MCGSFVPACASLTQSFPYPRVFYRAGMRESVHLRSASGKPVGASAHPGRERQTYSLYQRVRDSCYFLFVTYTSKKPGDHVPVSFNKMPRPTRAHMGATVSMNEMLEFQSNSSKPPCVPRTKRTLTSNATILRRLRYGISENNPTTN